MTQGFFRVAVATPSCTVGDCGENTANILALIKEAHAQNVSLAVFPELSVTGYTCGDLFSQELLSRVTTAAVRLIAEKTRDVPVTSVIGFPFAYMSARYNCAAVIRGGKVLGVVPKTHIPNYGEFYEMRHFTPAFEGVRAIPPGILGSEEIPFATNLLFTDEKNPDLSFAIELCEDLWIPSPPSSRHAEAGALIVANLSASNEIIGKNRYRKTLVESQSGRAMCAYLYANSGSGESTTDIVFSGHNLIAEYGTTIAESPVFSEGLLCADLDIHKLIQERRRVNTFPNSPETYKKILLPLDSETQYKKLLRKIDPLPFVPRDEATLAERCEQVLSIQTHGLMKRLSHIKGSHAVIGISGGLDSTLALLVTVRAFDKLKLDRGGITAVTMPGFGTTKKTKNNAHALAEALGITLEEIRIHKAVKQHFEDIGQNPETLDITYENSQARERTQILMDKANMTNGIVIGTGDMSELALGWATYNGDHMSMYGVNASVPKTLVRHLVSYCADNAHTFVEDEKVAKGFSKTLHSILDTPVSPELLPPDDGEISQKTEHIVGPYELHDFFLYYLTRWGYSPAKILYLAEQAFEEYEKKEILAWMNVFYRRFFAQQFKRSCMPDSPKVGSVSLSPRGDWRMPSDASAAVWLKELETLEGASKN